MKKSPSSPVPEEPGRDRPRRSIPFAAARRRLGLFGIPGVTMIEVMIALAIVSILFAMASYAYMAYVKKADIAKAVYHISNISSDIKIYQGEHLGALPETLDDLDVQIPLDPWGNPYQYQDVNTIPPGKRRKDKFLVPLNSDFDLWSNGPDGKSSPPLTSKHSYDDIIRAGDGRYIGVAENY